MRFSLRTLFIFVAIAAVGCCVWRNVRIKCYYAGGPIYFDEDENRQPYKEFDLRIYWH